MELIPILSTIILIATISTFILAIGAYVLYKVRERKGQATIVAKPAEVKAELVSPAPREQRAEQGKVMPQPIYIESPAPQQAAYQQPRKQAFVQPQNPQPMPAFSPYQLNSYRGEPANSQQPRQFSDPAFNQAKGYRGNQTDKSLDSKFLKYTSEGYVSAKEDNNAGALRWR